MQNSECGMWKSSANAALRTRHGAVRDRGIMSWVRTLLRSNRSFYTRVRSLLMRYRRSRHGLKSVHKTFYLSAGSQVSKDLVAGEYSYIGPGCLIGPKVQLGPYVMIGPRVSIVGATIFSTNRALPLFFRAVRRSNLQSSKPTRGSAVEPS